MATVWGFEVVSAVLFISFGVSCLLAWLIRPAIFRLSPAFVVWSFFLCHRHLWSLCFLCHRYLCTVSFMSFSAVGIHVRLFVFALLALVSGYQCCALAARQLHPWRFSRTGFFSKSVTLWTALQIPLWSKPHLVFRHKVYEIALSEAFATQMGVTEAQHQSQLVWIVQIWPIFASQRVDSAGTRAELCFGLLMVCYSLLQHSRPAWLELFVDHTHTHSMNSLRWQPHPLPRKSRDWWRTRDSSLGQPTENKIDQKPAFFIYFHFYFVISQTCDSSMVISHT